MSESVLALDKLLKDQKIKDNQQAQARLVLEKSLVDLDGRIEVKSLELQSAQARFEDESQLFKDGLLSREALRRTELSVKQTSIGLAQLATNARTSSGPPPSNWRGSRWSAAPWTRRRRRHGASWISRPRSRTAMAC